MYLQDLPWSYSSCFVFRSPKKHPQPSFFKSQRKNDFCGTFDCFTISWWTPKSMSLHAQHCSNHSQPVSTFQVHPSPVTAMNSSNQVNICQSQLKLFCLLCNFLASLFVASSASSNLFLSEPHSPLLIDYLPLTSSWVASVHNAFHVIVRQLWNFHFCLKTCLSRKNPSNVTCWSSNPPRMFPVESLQPFVYLWHVMRTECARPND